MEEIEIAGLIFAEAADIVGAVQEQLGLPYAVHLLKTPDIAGDIVRIKVDALQGGVVLPPVDVAAGN